MYLFDMIILANRGCGYICVFVYKREISFFFKIIYKREISNVHDILVTEMLFTVLVIFDICPLQTPGVTLEARKGNLSIAMCLFVQSRFFWSF